MGRGPLRPHGRGIHCDSFHQKAVARGASLGIRRILLFALVGFTFVPAARAQVCVPPPPGMVSWWPGDGNANDIQDGNHGTLRNGATFAPGKVAQAFSLDGVAAFVDVPNSPNLNITSSFTWDAWINPTSLINAPVIMSKEGSIPNRVGFEALASGALCGYFDSGTCSILSNPG